jgi:hypothetical protein
MRKLCTAAIAISLFASSAAWAETTLSPGKPAGVRQAQMGTKEILIFGGIAIAAITIVAVTSGGGGPLTQQLQGNASTTSSTAP